MHKQDSYPVSTNLGKGNYYNSPLIAVVKLSIKFFPGLNQFWSIL